MKKAIIIGATSGIGKELAVMLADEGWHVGITGRRAQLLREIERLSPDNFKSSAFDVTDREAVEKLEELIIDMGGMDLLVFSSGTGHLNPGLDSVLEYATNRLNVNAFTKILDFAYRYFEQKELGHIAAITSVMGLRGSRLAPAYAASKAYQINYLEGLRQKAEKTGDDIKITDLRPGSVDTEMMKGEGHFWISTPAKAAKTIMRALRKGKRVQYVTPRWKYIGLLLKILPRSIYVKM